MIAGPTGDSNSRRGGLATAGSPPMATAQRPLDRTPDPWLRTRKGGGVLHQQLSGRKPMTRGAAPASRDPLSLSTRLPGSPRAGTCRGEAIPLHRDP